MAVESDSPRALAGPLDLAQATAKDDYYRARLTAHLSDMASALLGTTWHARHQRAVELLGRALFYLATLVVSARGSPGEQHVKIVPAVSAATAQRWRGLLPALRRVSPVRRRLISLLLLDMAAAVATDRLPLLRKARLAMCYRGIEPLRWLLGLYYVRHAAPGSAGDAIVRLASTLLLAAVAIDGTGSLVRRWLRGWHGRQGDAVEVEDGLYCVLCGCRSPFPALTPCGHLTCWDCITSWVKEKEACPLCRSTMQLNQILLLSHYRGP